MAQSQIDTDDGEDFVDFNNEQMPDPPKPYLDQPRSPAEDNEATREANQSFSQESMTQRSVIEQPNLVKEQSAFKGDQFSFQQKQTFSNSLVTKAPAVDSNFSSVKNDIMTSPNESKVQERQAIKQIERHLNCKKCCKKEVHTHA